MKYALEDRRVTTEGDDWWIAPNASAKRSASGMKARTASTIVSRKMPPGPRKLFPRLRYMSGEPCFSALFRVMDRQLSDRETLNEIRS